MNIIARASLSQCILVRIISVVANSLMATTHCRLRQAQLTCWDVMCCSFSNCSLAALSFTFSFNSSFTRTAKASHSACFLRRERLADSLLDCFLLCLFTSLSSCSNNLMSVVWLHAGCSFDLICRPAMTSASFSCGLSSTAFCILNVDVFVTVCMCYLKSS